jgi:hypothetical protein
MNSRSSQCIHLSTPVAFYQPQPIPAFPLPHTEPLPHFTAPFAHTSLPRTPLPRTPLEVFVMPL